MPAGGADSLDVGAEDFGSAVKIRPPVVRRAVVSAEMALRSSSKCCGGVEAAHGWSWKVTGSVVPSGRTRSGFIPQ